MYRAAQLALTVILKLVVWSSEQGHLIVLSTVNLQLQGQFVPISLRPVLGIVQDGAAYFMATVWSSCSYFLYLLGVSVAGKQLKGHGSEYDL